MSSVNETKKRRLFQLYRQLFPLQPLHSIDRASDTDAVANEVKLQGIMVKHFSTLYKQAYKAKQQHCQELEMLQSTIHHINHLLSPQEIFACDTYATFQQKILKKHASPHPSLSLKTDGSKKPIDSYVKLI
mmetsp:Transcript_9431/g.13951  ORF Transcript_9431/g.13951 Transcript_9431/m.13951 type:complete len:131 (+) Transcript_9431:17-409(+)